MRRTIKSVVLLLLLPAITKAQEPTPLSLQDAMDYAVKNNATAKNSRLDYQKQKALNSETTGLALPQVSAKGEFIDYLNPLQTFVPGEFAGGPPGSFIPLQFSPKYSSTASANASQILFDGSVLVALQARNAVLRLYDLSARATEEEIRYNVQKSYYSLVAAQRQFAILEGSLAFLRKINSDLAATYDAGFVEKIEVDRSQLAVNNLATDSIRTISLIKLSEQLLKYQMGMDINQPIALTDTSVEEKIVEAQGLMSAEADYNNRTDFNVVRSQLELNKYNLKRYKYAGLPSLSAFGTAAYNYSTNTFSEVLKSRYIFYSLVGLQLNVPIFTGLQRHYKVEQAKIEVQKSQNNIDNMKLTIDLQEAQNKTTLKNALLMLDNQRKNFELANNVLVLAQKKYEAGVGSNLEVSQAQTEMLRAQGSFLNSMLDVVNASSDLKKTLGDFKQ